MHHAPIPCSSVALSMILCVTAEPDETAPTAQPGAAVRTVCCLTACRVPSKLCIPSGVADATKTCNMPEPSAEGLAAGLCGHLHTACDTLPGYVHPVALFAVGITCHASCADQDCVTAACVWTQHPQRLAWCSSSSLHTWPALQQHQPGQLSHTAAC